MLTGMTVVTVIILFFVFFAIYKRGMLSKMFTLNAAAPADQFQLELERTADAAIRRLENQISHLEMLLDEADIKIEHLDKRLQAADLALAKQELQQVSLNIAPTIDVRLPAEAPPPPAPTVVPPEEPPRNTLVADRRKLIITMAEQGYSVTEIAKTTGTGRGEIMLLLQLNKK